MALDFPSSPVNGQVYGNFYYNATKGIWKSLSSGASPNYLDNPTISSPIMTDATINENYGTPLFVVGANGSSNDLQDWIAGDGNLKAQIQSDGKLSINTGANAINIKASNTINHGYMSFYTENSTPTTRTGYFGFGSNGTTTLSLANERNGSTNFINGGATRMSIDSSGRVAKPNQPSFLAYRAAGNNWSQASGWNVLPYSSTKYNTGSHYNTSSYSFTAPVSGVYQFNVHVNVYSSNGVVVQAGFRVNGSLSYAGTRFATNTGGDNDSSASISLYLSANDYVQPMVSLSSAMSCSSGEYWSHFSGHFLG